MTTPGFRHRSFEDMRAAVEGPGVDASGVTAEVEAGLLDDLRRLTGRSELEGFEPLQDRDWRR